MRPISSDWARGHAVLAEVQAKADAGKATLETLRAVNEVLARHPYGEVLGVAIVVLLRARILRVPRLVRGRCFVAGWKEESCVLSRIRLHAHERASVA